MFIFAMWPRFEDGTDVNYGYALVNAKKAVYLPIIKEGHRLNTDGGGRHSQVDANLSCSSPGRCQNQFCV